MSDYVLQSFACNDKKNFRFLFHILQQKEGSYLSNNYTSVSRLEVLWHDEQLNHPVESEPLQPVG